MIREISQQDPDFQAAIGIDSSDQCFAPEVKWDPALSFSKPMLYDIIESNGSDRDTLSKTLDRAIGNNDKSFEVKADQINYALRIGDWVKLERSDIGLSSSLRIQKIDISSGKLTLNCGKQVFTIAQMFGDYLRKYVKDSEQSKKTQELTNGAGSFTALSDSGLRIYFEESFSTPTDGSTVSLTAFADISLNGKIVPPGRIKLENSSSLKIDITDYCSLGASNTVSRNLYNATGWTSEGAKITQYIAFSVI
jgi:hypothetical protein